MISDLNGEYVLDGDGEPNTDSTWTCVATNVTLKRMSGTYWAFSSPNNTAGGDVYTYGDLPYNSDGSSLSWECRGAISQGKVAVKA